MSISVSRRVHLPSQDNIPVSVESIHYVSSEGVSMIENCLVGELRVVRRSEDNGESWQEVSRQEPEKAKAASGRVIEQTPRMMYRDPATDMIVGMYLEYERDYSCELWEDQVCLTTRRPFYEISADGGETWSAPKPVIQTTGDYDEKRWLPGMEIGSNSGYADFEGGLTLDDGTMMFPWTGFRAGIEPGSVVHANGGWWIDCGSLFARWNEDRTDLEWELGEVVSVGRDKSSRGLCEPTVVSLGGNRLLMLMRGGQVEGCPAVKFWSVSEDGGRTWTDPEMLTYEDGSPMLTPSAMVRVVNWAAGGGVYLVTNILDVPPYQECDPRYPIQIAKLDTEKMSVIKDSITVIDDKGPEMPDYLRLSNFYLFEDRVSGDLRMHMSFNPGNVSWKDGDNIPREAFEYIISAE